MLEFMETEIVIKTEAENILKYKEFVIEIQRTWNLNARVIPVTIGATGTVSKSLREYLSNILGNQTVPEQHTGVSDSTLATYWGIRQYLSNILGNQTVPEQHTGESDST
jgi:hypothetical protein